MKDWPGTPSGLPTTFVFTKIEKEKFMNRQEADILKTLMDTPFANQRLLAEESGHSIGVVNRITRWEESNPLR